MNNIYNIQNQDNKLDYWLMFIDGDITLETLVELLNDYV
jgi:hypothetical protein